MESDPLKRAALATLLCVVCSPVFAQPQCDTKSGRAIVVDARTTIWVAPGQPVAIQKATEDLRNDFAKVFGVKPRLIDREQDARPVTIMIGESSALPEAMRLAPAEPESFSIFVAQQVSLRVGAAANLGQSAIVLTGPDMRGTIYAIYQFSQEYLGVDPMYYWTDREPARRTSISVPATLAHTYHAPVFKYRGFFINDEDLLTGWAPGEKKDKTGISLAVWDKIDETILRLKGNIIVPGTWIFPDDPQIKLAGERGLIVTQHHAIPLGLNVARWPADVPYNYTAHPEILEHAWKNAVAAYDPQQEILWSVGLRGLSDVSYGSSDPSVAGNDKALGHLIGAAIADQMKIVRAVHPNAKFVTDFWQEGARLMQQGDLKIPPEVIPVWADAGYGYLLDNGEVAAGQGAYYHVAMMNNRANQLTEMVPVDRIYSELGRYIQAGATQYVLLNTSDIRPVSMTAKAVLDVAWGGLPAKDAGGSDGYYREWAKKEFGEQAAAKVAGVYEEYFKAPARSGDPALEYGDQLYHTEARQMALEFMINSPLYSLPSQAPKWIPPRLAAPYAPSANGSGWLDQTVQKEIQQCGDAQPRWDAAWRDAVAVEPLVVPERRAFYHAEVLTMIAINRDSNRMLFLVSSAIRDSKNGDAARARQEAEDALKALDDIHQMELGAEYGKWKNWYRGDWLTGVPRTREIVQALANYLDDPLTPLPAPAIWNRWEAYYHIMHYEGDRSVDVH
jgi:Glycosyl hydrolase family 115